MISSIRNSVSSACAKQTQNKLLNEVFKPLGIRLDDTTLEKIQKGAESLSMGALLFPGIGLPISRFAAAGAAGVALSRAALQNRLDKNLALTTPEDNLIDAGFNTLAATSLPGIARSVKNLVPDQFRPNIGVSRGLGALRTRRIQDLTPDELNVLGIGDKVRNIRQSGSLVLGGPSSAIPRGGGPSVFSPVTSRGYRLNDPIDPHTAAAIGYTDPMSGLGPVGQGLLRSFRGGISDPLTNLARFQILGGPSVGQIARSVGLSDLTPTRDLVKNYVTGGPTELTTKRLIPGGPTRMNTVLGLYGRTRDFGNIGIGDLRSFQTPNFLPTVP